MSQNKPFFISAACQAYLWGGTRLCDDYGQTPEVFPLAEAWVCSTHPDGISLIRGGKNDGRKLTDVFSEHPEYLGTHPDMQWGQLPVLIKLIDAKSDLSVQVHPDDAYAEVNENGQPGKTEMWYVLHASPGAKIVYGFKRDVSKIEIQQALNEGTIEKLLQYVPVEKDDVFFVDPGTVHAIGEGIVIAEIQECSNLTYRLYDYDRIDKTGKKRELHIEKALDVVNMHSSSVPVQPLRVLEYKRGYAKELLGRCKYFMVERLLLNTERYRDMADCRTSDNTFKVLLCTDGCGVIFGEETMLNFFKGDCIFVPADSVPLKMHGQAQFLIIGC